MIYEDLVVCMLVKFMGVTKTSMQLRKKNLDSSHFLLKVTSQVCDENLMQSYKGSLSSNIWLRFKSMSSVELAI